MPDLRIRGTRSDGTRVSVRLVAVPDGGLEIAFPGVPVVRVEPSETAKLLAWLSSYFGSGVSR